MVETASKVEHRASKAASEVRDCGDDRAPEDPQGFMNPFDAPSSQLGIRRVVRQTNVRS
jgi:hypothetical protein